MKAICDNCKHKFELEQKDIFKRNLQDDIEETYFICPNCKDEFRVMITNKEVRKLEDDFKTAQKYVAYTQKSSKRKVIKQAIKESERKHKKYKAALNRLNNKG